MKSKIFEGSFLLFFLLPLIALVVLYISMGVTISRWENIALSSNVVEPQVIWGGPGATELLQQP